jgi:hypothetical protein
MKILKAFLCLLVVLALVILALAEITSGAETKCREDLSLPRVLAAKETKQEADQLFPWGKAARLEQECLEEIRLQEKQHKKPPAKPPKPRKNK